MSAFEVRSGYFAEDLRETDREIKISELKWKFKRNCQKYNYKKKTCSRTEALRELLKKREQRECMLTTLTTWLSPFGCQSDDTAKDSEIIG